MTPSYCSHHAKVTPVAAAEESLYPNKTWCTASFLEKFPVAHLASSFRDSGMSLKFTTGALLYFSRTLALDKSFTHYEPQIFHL